MPGPEVLIPAAPRGMWVIVNGQRVWSDDETPQPLPPTTSTLMDLMMRASAPSIASQSLTPALPAEATAGMLAPSRVTDAPPPDWTQQAVGMGLRTVPAAVGSAFGPVGGFMGGSLGELAGELYEGRPVNWGQVGMQGALNLLPGLGAGRQVTRLGLNAADAALPTATSALAENAMSRLMRGALSGATLAPVSTMGTNAAEGRPLTENLGLNTVMGAATGGAIGGAMEGGRAAAPYVARGAQQMRETLGDLAGQYPQLWRVLTDETGAVGDLGPRAPVGIERGQFVMSNRIPKVAPEGGQPLVTNMDVVRAHPELEARVADAVRLSPLVTAKQARLSPRGITEAFVDTAQQNLQVLVRQMGRYAEGARQWYDGAHAIARALSGPDFTTNQTSGVLAVLSPQKDWHMNAEMGRQLVEGYRLASSSNLPFSPELYQHYANTALLSTQSSIKQRVRQGALDAADAQLALQDASAGIERFRRYVGVSFSDLPLQAKARMLRALGEQEFGSTFPVVAPSGTLGDVMRTKAGAPAKMTWNGYKMLEKALSILEDGSAENISRQLGAQHKVRAFYNNINAPWSSLASTVDTHQVAGSHLQPMAQSHPAVGMSMGGLSHVVSGVSGTNPLYQEALAREGAASGMLPREVQSVSWEGLKGLWSPEDKRDAAIAESVRKLWNEYRQGRRSLEQVQQDIVSLSAFTPPVWSR